MLQSKNDFFYHTVYTEKNEEYLFFRLFLSKKVLPNDHTSMVSEKKDENFLKSLC